MEQTIKFQFGRKWLVAETNEVITERGLMTVHGMVSIIPMESTDKQHGVDGYKLTELIMQSNIDEMELDDKALEAEASRG